jgi:catechol 2,3-dioxygenase-like lactoylglutathione lyase family enzyme
MKALLAMIVIALLSQTRSVGERPQAPFAGVSGAFFALSVADLDASANWYADKFGMSVVLRVPRQDKASVVVLEGGGLTVELVQHDDAVGAPKEIPLVRGIFKVGLVVDDLDKTLAGLKVRGVPVLLGPYPARGQVRSNAIINDNAGNLIQFFGK